MRIASGLISILLSVIVFFQSAFLTVGGGIFGDESAAGGGAMGILIAFLLFIAGAFAFALPKVAMVISILAALAAFMNYVGGDFPDMGVWAVFALILAVMNFFAGRRPKPAATEATDS